MPLFSDLSTDAFKHVIDVLDLQHAHHGESIVRQGEPGDSFFVVAQGLVRVFRESEDVGCQELARLGGGSILGEMAVILDTPRSATVTAVEKARVAEVTGAVISGALEGASPLLARMLRSLSDRLRQEAERAKQ